MTRGVHQTHFWKENRTVMSLAKKGAIVNFQDRNRANQDVSGGPGRGPSNASNANAPGKVLPPLRPWDGSFPFDLIREITSPDLIDNIPKYDYYRAPHAKEAISVSLYHVPCYLLHHVTNLAKISPTRSHSRDSMFAAAVLYGSKRFYSSPEYLHYSREHNRFTLACTCEEIDTLDQDDIQALLRSYRLIENDCARGYKPRINYRLPEHIHLQILPPEREMLHFSQSALWVRFYMDALREAPEGIPSPHLRAMNEAIDDLYLKVNRLGKRLERMLDSLEIEPSETADQ